MSRRVGLAVIALGVGVALLIGSGLAGAGGEARKGGTVRIWSASELPSVDPALANDTDSWVIGFATCAKLFNHRDVSGEAGTRPVPEVVDRFTISKDGLTHTFELRKTFRFHTGAPVTARSFADAFNRVAQPNLVSPAATFIREIVGAPEVIDGKARSVSGVHVLGRYRLQIRLTKPLGDFTARLTMPFFCPILPRTPVDPAGIDNPPGSGPYYVAERVVNQRTVLERNPYYRGDRPANVDRIVWTPGQSLEACLQAVEEDRADFCGEPGAPRTAYRRLVEQHGVNRPGGRLYVRPALATSFFAFNHARPAFKGAGQVPLKKAINFAVDRPALTRAFGSLAGRRTDQMLPPALTRAASIYPLGGANVVAARRWYAKARLKPTRLVLYAWSFPPHVTAAQVFAYNLEQLGIDLEIKYFDAQTVIDRARTPGEPVDIVMSGWGADYPDGAGFLVSLLARDGAANLVNLDDPELRRRMTTLSRLTGEARRRAWADFDIELMRSNPPWVPFMHLQSRTFVSRSLGCFVEHPLYRVDLAAVCKK